MKKRSQKAQAAPQPHFFFTLPDHENAPQAPKNAPARLEKPNGETGLARRESRTMLMAEIERVKRARANHSQRRTYRHRRLIDPPWMRPAFSSDLMK